MSSFRSNMWKVPALGLISLAAACGADQAGDSVAVAGTEAPVAQIADAERQSGAEAPATTGEVIEVRMTMPGGRDPVFEPADITAKPGDVIRFINVENVHNVSFPKGNNPAGAALPAPSPYLTQPGQTYDLTVELPAGTYNFQCDPHLAMGMTGTLTVTE